MRSGAAALLWCLAVAAVAPRARADDKDTCASAAEQSQLLRRQQRLREAHEQLLVCVRDICPKVVKADCVRWLGEVDAALPSIVVRATDDAGRELTDARVVIDGRTVAIKPGPEAIVLDPGQHVIRVEASGLLPSETRVTLRAGARRSPVSLVLQREEAAPAPVEPSPLPPSTSTPAPTPTPMEASTPTPEPLAPERPRSRVPATAWVLGGAGVAAVGTGVVLWILGQGDRSDLYNRCGAAGACTAGDISSSKQSAQTKLVVGDVAFGVGLVAVGAAVWLALSSKQPAVATQAGVGVAPVAGGALMSYRWRF